MNRLDGKVAFLSGAARGIGGATAKLMASVGAKVMIGDVLDERGRQTAKEIEAAGGRALYVSLDVTSETSWVAAIDATVKAFGQLDVLVNNAGIFNGKGVEDALAGGMEQAGRREPHWRRAGHARGVGRRSRPAGRGTSTARRSSTSRPWRDWSVRSSIPLYSLTKGGVTLFTKSTALEFGRKGYRIRVNSIHPGVIDTDMGQQTFAMRAPGAGHQRHRGHAQGLGQHASDREAGRRRRYRQGHRVPGLRRCRLHDRRRTGRRWRLYGAVKAQVADAQSARCVRQTRCHPRA